MCFDLRNSRTERVVLTVLADFKLAKTELITPFRGDVGHPVRPQRGADSWVWMQIMERFRRLAYPLSSLIVSNLACFEVADIISCHVET